MLGHHPLHAVHAPEQRNHAVGVFLLQILVNLQQRKGDQLHPQFLDLVNDLKLQLVAIAQLVVLRLAAQQRLGVQVQLVVQRPVAAHERVKLFPVHRFPPGLPIFSLSYSCWLPP